MTTNPKFVQLQDISEDLSDGILDPTTQRSQPATSANPLATIDDVLTRANALKAAQAQSTQSTGAINPWIDFTWPADSSRLQINLQNVFGENENAHGHHVIDLNNNTITGFGVGGSPFITFTNDTYNGTAVAAGQRLEANAVFIDIWDPGNRRIVLRLETSPTAGRAVGAIIQAY